MILGPDGEAVALPSTQLADGKSAVVRANMRQYLIDTLADTLDHATAVAAGRHLYRQAVMKSLGAFFIGNTAQLDVISDSMYGFLQEQWRAKWPSRYPNHAYMTPSEWLDKVHIPKPETEAEREEAIANSWELEIAGDEQAMRQHYEGSARVRKGAWLGSKQRG